MCFIQYIHRKYRVLIRQFKLTAILGGKKADDVKNLIMPFVLTQRILGYSYLSDKTEPP